MIRRILLLAILVVPGVAADWGATNEGGVLSHIHDSFVQSRTNPAAGQIFSEAVPNTNDFPHYALNHTHGIVEITYTATILMETTGTWEYTFSLDGVEMPSCSFSIRTIDPPGIAQVVIEYPAQQIFCLLNLTLTGTPITFNATRTSVAGTPSAITHEVISYQITAFYHLEQDMSNDLIEFIQAYFFLGAFFLLLAWGQRERSPIIYAAAILVGGLGALTPGIDNFMRLILIVLMLLAAAMVFNDAREGDR